ncbi:response regulator transcription factor [Sphingobacterium griseoflavum]|uniref:DNA-binding response regulator n=1 Tax=Sphingobacterium griseoflavum TaxID=1474952 RepID=A0ABQ3I2C3_9SPHI|nr:response regulator transcription factor [Sphingobacterium griseoflavum]GHE47847.1 DNA-binding response regulator [Sphingobacterium griseoflavum]
MIDVLLVDDEEKLGRIVTDRLRAKAFRVRQCLDGLQAWKSFQLSKPDVVIVDVMMPRMDGFALTTKIREHDKAVPILFLTARASVEDVLKGFDIGGNDYLKKPFHIEELIARVVSLAKMSNKYNPNDRIIIGEYVLNAAKQLLLFGDQEIALSFRESELLRRLVERKNTVIPRREILLEFWDGDPLSAGRSLDVFVSRLRKYLREDPNISIVNIRHVGYQMRIR